MKFWQALAFFGSGAVVVLLLIAVAQPLFTDDLWWHLALGERYLALGLWLESDPFLFTAPGPPAPAAWLADVFLHGAVSGVGFQGLRVVHLGLVVCVLVLVFGAARRASGGSWAVAALAVALFSVLGTYRLIQLRPHLFTMLGGLLLFRLAIEPRLPSWRQVAGVAALFAFWVNLHAGFLLGPILLGAATGGVAGQVLLERGVRPESRVRLGRLAAALGLGLLATLLNPEFISPHMLYFSAGGATPELGGVTDEWSPVRLFAWPAANLPPSPLSWVLVWGLVLATLGVLGRALWAWRRDGFAAGEGDAARDVARVAVAAVSVIGMLTAVRFLWLGIFAMLPVVAGLGMREGGERWRGLAIGLKAVALVPAFFYLGDWPMVSRAVDMHRYRDAYPAVKWNAHAVWWLADTGLEGNLFNTYSYGNFLGYWLSPKIRVFLNGSLNVHKQTMRDYAALRRRAPGEGDTTFLETLDRQGVDIFLGTGLPRIPQANRGGEYTANHLEGAPGWIRVFRNLRNAVYLRDHERSRENLERVAAYYAGEGVPFDPEEGFQPAEAIESAPGWALRNGLMPSDFRTAQAAVRRRVPAQKQPGLARLASMYAVLGDFERAIYFDRSHLEIAPNLQAARRLVWSLLHARRFDEAVEAAGVLRELAPASDGLSMGLADVAERLVGEEDAVVVDGTIAGLPLLLDVQASSLLAFFEEAKPRPVRVRTRDEEGDS